jgi:hypothetical protein
MADLRTCDCPHQYPICACCEGRRGRDLAQRSSWLSSLCGWPGTLLGDDLVVAVLAEFGHPIDDPDHPAAWPWPAFSLPLAQAMGPRGSAKDHDCGCGCGGDCGGHAHA